VAADGTLVPVDRPGDKNADCRARAPARPVARCRVARKLLLGFGVLGLLVIAVGTTGLVELNRAGAPLDPRSAENLQATTLPRRHPGGGAADHLAVREALGDDGDRR
jgi:hypothetical protein